MEFKDAKESGFDQFQMNTIQMELINIIKKGKLEPSKTYETQASEALELITTEKISALKEELIALFAEKIKETTKAIDGKITVVEQKTKDSISETKNFLEQSMLTTKKEWDTIKPELQNYTNKILKIHTFEKTQEVCVDGWIAPDPFEGTRGGAWNRENRTQQMPMPQESQKKITCTLSGEYFSTTKPILLHIRGHIKRSDLDPYTRSNKVSFVTNLSSIGIPNQGWQNSYRDEVQIVKDELIVLPKKISVDDDGKFSITLAARH